MRENELSRFTKISVAVLIALASAAAFVNIADGAVVNPDAFLTVPLGFLFFSIAKISVIAQGRWISFGPGPMSADMANLYRLGYWLMVVGTLVTFE